MATKRVKDTPSDRKAQSASEPETPHFPATGTLEEQAYHAMQIMTCVRLLALSGVRMEQEDREAAADLLWGAQHFLESLDPPQVAFDKEQAKRKAREAVTRGKKAA